MAEGRTLFERLEDIAATGHSDDDSVSLDSLYDTLIESIDQLIEAIEAKD